MYLAFYQCHGDIKNEVIDFVSEFPIESIDKKKAPTNEHTKLLFKIICLLYDCDS